MKSIVPASTTNPPSPSRGITGIPFAGDAANERTNAKKERIMNTDPATIEARRAQILRELGFEGDTPPARPTLHKPVDPVAVYEVSTPDGVYALAAADDGDEVEF